jgi:hypothetical protein
MNNDNHDQMFEELQGLWQNHEPVDTTAIARKARMIWWRMRILYGIEFIAGIVGCILAVYIGFYMTPFTIVFGLMLFSYMVLALYEGTRVRKGTWGSDDDTVEGLLKLQIRRAEGVIAYLKMNIRIGYYGLILFPMAIVILYDSDKGLFEPRFINASMVFIGVFILILLQPLLFKRPIDKKEAEIANLKEMLETLKSED